MVDTYQTNNFECIANKYQQESN